MNYKALATIFLLALPMLMVPLAAANQPVWNVEFRIRPGATKFMGPCLVSTAFPIDVYLWNDKSLTGVGVYAYDFYVWWNNDQGFSLVNFVNHIPWASGKYFLIVNETGTSGLLDFYHLAVTAVGNSTIDPSLELGSTGLFNASIVTLNFHIDSEPFWPASFAATFGIGNELGYDPLMVDPTKMPHVSTGCTVPITNIEIDHGTYLLEVGQPNIDPEATLAAPYPLNITVGAIDVTETVYIHLTNITGAYGFGFTLTYDPDWKTTDIQHITILPAFAPPYEFLEMHADTPGVITFELMKPSEKPTICSKDIAVVKIDFVSTLTQEIGVIPFDHDGAFVITEAFVMSKDEQTTVTYSYPGDLIYSGDLGNLFRPKSIADLTLDGIVDIADLAAVAMEYGNAHPYAALVAPPGNVDIFDIVFVAKRFGDPEW